MVSYFFLRLLTNNAAAKLFNGEDLHQILSVVEPLVTDADKFKQAAAAEILTGLLRGMSDVRFGCVYAQCAFSQDRNIGPRKHKRSYGLGSPRALM